MLHGLDRFDGWISLDLYRYNCYVEDSGIAVPTPYRSIFTFVFGAIQHITGLRVG